MIIFLVRLHYSVTVQNTISNEAGDKKNILIFKFPQLKECLDELERHLTLPQSGESMA